MLEVRESLKFSLSEENIIKQLNFEQRAHRTGKISNSFCQPRTFFCWCFFAFSSCFRQSEKTRKIIAKNLESEQSVDLAGEANTIRLIWSLRNFRRVFPLHLCTCKTIFFSCYFHTEFARESEVKIFAGLWESLPQLSRDFCELTAARRRCWARRFKGSGKKSENFPVSKANDFVFSYEQRYEYAEQRKNSDVKEKNLFFFSFRKRKFNSNFFLIKCRLFTNFPLLH